MSEANTEAYSASKGGLVALTHALSISLAPEVRVNCVSPGWIFTKGEPPRPEDHAFHPAGRVGTPEDIAAVLTLLCSSDSDWITGQTIVADGGLSLRQ